MMPLTQLEVEHRRAMARRILSVDPANLAIQAALQALLTPEYLAAAAREGILVVSPRAIAAQARALVELLQQKGIPAYLDLIDERASAQATFAHVGVVVMACTRHSAAESAMRQYYDQVMAMGKVVVPVMSCDDTMPSLPFDVQPLCVESHLIEAADSLVALFSAVNV